MSKMLLPGVLHLEDFEIAIEDIQSSVVKLMECLRPSWDAGDIIVEALTGGFVNKMCTCTLKNNKAHGDVIIIRVYGTSVGSVFDHDAEMITMKILQTVGVGQPLYAKFKNGIAYGYAHGECLDEKSMGEKHIARLIASEMAKYHCVDPKKILPDINLGERFTKPVDAGALMNRAIMTGWMHVLPEDISSLLSDPDKVGSNPLPINTKTELWEEFLLLKSVLLPLKPPIVFCHCDLNPFNIIHDREHDKVQFIDFEVSGYGFEALDIAYHFIMFTGIAKVDVSCMPDKEYQLWWLRQYLQNQAEERGMTADSVTERDVGKLYIIVSKFILYAYFMVGVWTLAQADKKDTILDFARHGTKRLQQYFLNKEELLSL